MCKPSERLLYIILDDIFIRGRASRRCERVIDALFPVTQAPEQRIHTYKHLLNKGG